jgi:L-ribulose-5-phosphate 3-epimerase
VAGPWRIGACSWSLEPRTVDELAERALTTGVSCLQLALDPIRTGAMGLAETRRRLREAGLDLVSGMMAMAGEDYSTPATIRRTGGLVPDATWPANRRAAGELATIGAELGLTLVTFHAGFPGDTFATLRERLAEVASIFSGRGIRIGLETGQESPTALLELLDQLPVPGVGVNFDPGNLILYGAGDPVAALRLLGPRVLQLHAKDALPALSREDWGTEVPVGTGAVDWAALLAALGDCPQVTALMIEREAGPSRIADVAQARAFLAAAIE